VERRIDLTESNPLLDTVEEWFRADGWVYQRGGTARYLRMSVHGEEHSWFLVADTDETAGVVLVYSIAPTCIDVTQRTRVAEFVVRANHGLMIGNLELSFATGDVRYKTSIAVDRRTDLRSSVMDRLVNTNLRTFERYLPGIAAVAQGADPEAAVDRCEGVRSH